MKIAKCSVGAAIYVPAGEYLDGVTLTEPTWARPGEHTLEHEFAHAQEQNGYLEIIDVDGAPALWGACCADH